MHQVHVVHPHLKLLHIQMTNDQPCLCGWFDLVISEFSFRMSPFSFLVRFRQLQYNRQH